LNDAALNQLLYSSSPLSTGDHTFVEVLITPPIMPKELVLTKGNATGYGFVVMRHLVTKVSLGRASLRTRMFC
jgi:hypothetical protein